jgi:hypothetical protein
MEQFYAIVGAGGEIEIPAAICASVGMVGETQVAVWVDGDRIILQAETVMLSSSANPDLHTISEKEALE